MSLNVRAVGMLRATTAVALIGVFVFSGITPSLALVNPSPSASPAPRQTTPPQTSPQPTASPTSSPRPTTPPQASVTPVPTTPTPSQSPSPSTPPGQGGNPAPNPVPLIEQAQIGRTLTANPGSQQFFPGNTITYTYTARNSSNAVAKNVRLRNLAPTGAAVLSNSLPGRVVFSRALRPRTETMWPAP